MLKSCFDLITFQKNKRYKDFRKLIANYFTIDERKVFLYGAGRMGVYEVLKSLNLSQNDEVIVAGYTCVVLTNVVEFADCQIKYVDISPNTLNIDTDLLLDGISSNTKVIIMPHNFGVLDESIDQIRAKFPSIFIIEDAAHTFGSRFISDGKLAGLKGDAAFFSMEFSKPISTGLGGILLVNNETIIDSLETSYKEVPYFSFANNFKIFLTFMVMNLTMWKKSNAFFILLMIIMRKLRLLYATSNEEIYGKKPQQYPVKLAPSLSIFGYYQLKEIEVINEKKSVIAHTYADFFSQFSSLKQFYKDSYIMVRYPIVFSDETTDDTIKRIKDEAEKEGLAFGNWFNDVVHPDGLYRYGYTANQCMVGENVSTKIINLPININMKPTFEELTLLKEIFIRNSIN